LWIATPADFLRAHNFFEKERSYWWRKQIAKPTIEHNREKYDKLMSDIPALLQYYNAVLHVRDLCPKQTLKHTVTLSALTVEGRTYENGQGRSISSECRHIIVRTLCDIPIKPRPPRVGVGAAAGSGKTDQGSSKKRKIDPHVVLSAFASADASHSAPRPPKLARLPSAVDSVAKVPLGRLSSSDWPMGLGFQNSDPPKLSEEEQLVFSQTAEKLLLLSSLSASSVGMALAQPSQDDDFDMLSPRNGTSSLGPNPKEKE
jgi:hypothetical protein